MNEQWNVREKGKKEKQRHRRDEERRGCRKQQTDASEKGRLE
jgi:hypothetical protein